MSYCKLQSKSSIKDALLSLAKNSTTDDWMLLRGFDVMPAPRKLLLTDPLIVALSNRFTIKPGMFKMNPRSYYNFHVDSTRNVAINMLLEGPDSYTMFGEQTESIEVTNVTDQLIYEDSAYYIFNTASPHSVLNLSQNTRYLLTIGIPDLNVSYEDVKNFCVEAGL